MLLSKGFEVEMYTGTPAGEVVGFSDKIVAALDGFVREPDARNVEYTTAPFCRYEHLLCELIKPRVKLRDYLKTLGDYTIIPGSTLPLGGADTFHRSDPKNPYHTYIEKTYGTDVVTASIHINIGISNLEELIRACRLIRLEAPLYLALTASSPFFDGNITGFHSTRWQLFPQTPAYVPLFESHLHHIRWVEEQMDTGGMQSVRHLWSSVRPNGDRRPYNLNRLELRICDLVTDPLHLLAVTALLEARLVQMLKTPSLDPLQSCALPAQTRAEDLVEITLSNEKAVAKQSLDAQLYHWQTGKTVTARAWISQLYEEVYPFAKHSGIACFLNPIKQILRNGNQAQQWLQQAETSSPTDVIQGAITQMQIQESQLAEDICTPTIAYA
ncbi:glutamate--cysteine ligase, putative [Synechococcus sp. PCC 7335]|uniref:glutamate--cysteine ligase n=1 Tax=Synechococcus sp. (strain ATCC 29403 / PCC 7335) TaxID=91464 RepID=UPI00017EE415|nr:glutamate--cysteine ligase [Synechococcus sp. PCC 7335]EDX85680.1 glutamate--cysteine ligase, putative [Synechococcus sp. PCC 7335]